MNIELTIIAVIIFCVVGFFLSLMILLIKNFFVKSGPCIIEINNDPSLTKSVEGGNTLLNSLIEQGIAVPSPCGGKATCKQCKVQIIEGGGSVLATDKANFTPRQLREGWRLSCQTKVRNNLKLKLPENILSLREIKGTVISNRNVATFIKELIVQIPESEDFNYIPGDYMQFHVPRYHRNTAKWTDTIDKKYYLDWKNLGLFNHIIDYKPGTDEVIRAYSMASYPKEGNILKFNIRIATPPIIKGKVSQNIPWGVCSSYIFGLKEGDQLKLSGPFGESHMIEDNRELIFLIGGAGSSFGRSHIIDLFKTKNTKRTVTLWYGARSLKENIYQEEYQSLEKEYKNFYYKIVLSDPTEEDLINGWPKDDPIKTNYVFQSFEDGQLKYMEDPENALYYVCGPPLHNKSVINLLDNYGVTKENIILDDFGS